MDRFTVWVNIHNRIVSFCEMQNCEVMSFRVKDHFMSYLMELQAKGYQFQ